jgi:omega-amidase
VENILKIAIVQTDIVWQNAKENVKRYSEKINSINEDIDIVVLPEMFSTGFSMEPEGISETMQGETVHWMKNLASDKNAAICGSLIILEDDNFYNRFLFVQPSGEITYYDKRHLFTLAGEERVYTQGNEKLVIDYKGWKICPLVCYDLRFPVWSRNVEAYDVLLYVANWPKPRIVAWDTLLKARSIENMCYVIGVNRVGVDANGYEYSGHSAAYDSLGEQLTSPISNEEFVEIVTLNKTNLNDVRKRLNFLNDKDSFEILK